MSYMKHSVEGLFYDYHHHRIVAHPVIRPRITESGGTSCPEKHGVDKVVQTSEELPVRTIYMRSQPNPHITDFVKRCLKFRHVSFRRMCELSSGSSHMYVLQYEIDSSSILIEIPGYDPRNTNLWRVHSMDIATLKLTDLTFVKGYCKRLFPSDRVKIKSLS